MVEGN